MPWVPLAVVAAAVVVRVAWMLVVEVDPRTSFAWDMTFYDLAAQRLTQGALMRDLEGIATARWSPGYPILLGTAYTVFGSHLVVAKLANVLFAAIAVLATVSLGTRLGGRRVGITAGLLLAFLPGHVYYTPLLLSEPPFVAFFAVFLLLVVRADDQEEASPWAWLGIGAWLGATILVRGAAVFFFAVPALGWWLAGRAPSTVLRRSGLVLAGVIALIAPWTVRNVVTLGAPVLISTQQMGMALTFAHSEVATGGMSMGMARYREEQLAAFRDLPQPQREVAENRDEVARALRWMLENPDRELAMLPKRWLHFFAHDHTGLTWATPKDETGRPKEHLVGPREDRVLATTADVFFYALLVLAVAGLPACFDPAARARLLLPLAVLYFLGLHGLLFAGDARFHAPLYPVFAILASFGARELGQRVRRVGYTPADSRATIARSA